LCFAAPTKHTCCIELVCAYARDLLYGAGYISMAFIALALFAVTLTKPRQTAALSA
jgi:hypothetical protein